VRPRIKGEGPISSPIILKDAVRKPPDAATTDGSVYQSDYQERWKAD